MAFKPGKNGRKPEPIGVRISKPAGMSLEDYLWEIKEDRISSNGVDTSGRYGRIPVEVASDPYVPITGHSVYNYLSMNAIGGPNVSASYKDIADWLGLHRNTVSVILRILEARGHIAIMGSGKYRLLSPMFRRIIRS